MTQRDAVEVRVGTKTYRIVASADSETLNRLAALVDQKLQQVDSRHPDALVLAALALAHDVHRLEAECRRVTLRSRGMLKSLLQRVDAALEFVDENGDPLPPVAP